MDWKTRVVPVMLIVIAIAALVCSYGLYNLRAVDQEQKIACASQAQIAVKANHALGRKIRRIATEREQVSMELALMSQQRDVLTRQVETMDEHIAVLEDELTSKEQMVSEVLNRLEARDGTIKQLLAQIDGERSITERLQKDLARTRNNLLQDRFARRSLETELKSIKDEYVHHVELDKIIISSVPRREGKIMVINDEFDFVIVNLGEKDHVSLGSIMGIYRDDMLISRVQVEEVRMHTCAATVLPEWQEARIDLDDIVLEL